MKQQKNVIKVVCAGRLRGADRVVRYRYGSPAYSELCDWKQLQRTHGEGLMAVTLKQFSKSIFKVLDTNLNGRAAERTVWIIPAPLCCMQCTNDAKFLWILATDMVKWSPSWQNGVSLVEVVSPGNLSEPQLLGILSNKALQKKKIRGSLRKQW